MEGEQQPGIKAWVRRQWDSAANGSQRRFFWSIFIPVAAVYLATTSWGLPDNPDTLTNTYTAWSLGTTGSPAIATNELATIDTLQATWLQERPIGWVSPYPPGAALLAAPLYAIAPSDGPTITFFRPRRGLDGVESVTVELPPIGPGSVTAALASAATIAFLGLTFRLLGTGSEALVGAYVAGLGTSMWSVASDALWQHGPSTAWLSLGVYLAHKRRYWGAGAAFGAALLSRQLTAVIAAAMGVFLASRLRTLKPLVRIGVATTIALIAISTWNWWLFGRFHPAGGGLTISGRLTGSVGGGRGDLAANLPWWENFLRGLFDPIQGFMVLTPLFLILAFWIPRAWRLAPPATRAAALGGLVYLIIQYKIQVFGTRGHLGYRYPLEGLTAMAPLWFLSFIQSYRWSQLVPPSAAALSVALQTFMAIRR